jgi:hypothetical protein
MAAGVTDRLGPGRIRGQSARMAVSSDGTRTKQGNPLADKTLTMSRAICRELSDCGLDSSWLLWVGSSNSTLGICSLPAIVGGNDVTLCAEALK